MVVFFKIRLENTRIVRKTDFGTSKSVKRFSKNELYKDLKSCNQSPLLQMISLKFCIHKKSPSRLAGTFYDLCN